MPKGKWEKVFNSQEIVEILELAREVLHNPEIRCLMGNVLDLKNEYLLSLGEKLEAFMNPPTEGELTEAQLGRQDWVDDGCEGLIKDLAGREIEHNIELIGIVRDAVQKVIVNRLHLMTEMEFYPYIKLEESDDAKKIREYLAEGGSKCLYCGSKDIEGGKTEMDGDGGTCQITCNDCGKEWYDCYTLIGVLPI